MTRLTEFIIRDGGTADATFTATEAHIVSALAAYADLMLDPKHDHDRIAGWILARTNIKTPLMCQSQKGIGWDITVGLAGTSRMIEMRRYYLYARRDPAHIADQWKAVWRQDVYRNEYLKQLNPCLGESGERNYYIMDGGPRHGNGLILFNQNRDNILVVRSSEGAEIHFDHNGNVEHKSRPFSPTNASHTVYC